MPQSEIIAVQRRITRQPAISGVPTLSAARRTFSASSSRSRASWMVTVDGFGSCFCPEPEETRLDWFQWDRYTPSKVGTVNKELSNEHFIHWILSVFRPSFHPSASFASWYSIIFLRAEHAFPVFSWIKKLDAANAHGTKSQSHISWSSNHFPHFPTIVQAFSKHFPSIFQAILMVFPMSFPWLSPKLLFFQLLRQHLLLGGRVSSVRCRSQLYPHHLLQPAWHGGKI